MDRRANGWLRSTIASILDREDRPLSGRDIALRLDPSDGLIHHSAIFRALDRLIAAGTIRRIECTKGYVPRRRSATIDLLCGECGTLLELPGDDTREALDQVCRSRTFSPGCFIVEVPGTCPACAVTT